MKVGIVSDTHGCSATWKKLYNKFFSDADLIFHAGDILYHGPRNTIPSEYNPKELAELLNSCPIPIITACGNCDAEVDSMVLNFPIQAPYAFVYLQGLRILITHGHILSEEKKLLLADKYKADLFITGHTHIASLDKQKNTFFLNPGSPSMTKRSDQRSTAAILTDEKLIIFDINTGAEILAANLL